MILRIPAGAERVPVASGGTVGRSPEAMSWRILARSSSWFMHDKQQEGGHGGRRNTDTARLFVHDARDRESDRDFSERCRKSFQKNEALARRKAQEPVGHELVRRMLLCCRFSAFQLGGVVMTSLRLLGA